MDFYICIQEDALLSYIRHNCNRCYWLTWMNSKIFIIVEIIVILIVPVYFKNIIKISLMFLKKFWNNTVYFFNGNRLLAHTANEWLNCCWLWFRVATCSSNSERWRTNCIIWLLKHPNNGKRKRASFIEEINLKLFISNFHIKSKKNLLRIFFCLFHLAFNLWNKFRNNRPQFSDHHWREFRSWINLNNKQHLELYTTKYKGQ